MSDKGALIFLEPLALVYKDSQLTSALESANCDRAAERLEKLASLDPSSAGLNEQGVFAATFSCDVLAAFTRQRLKPPVEELPEIK